MRRAPPVALYGGIVVAVVGLSSYHARVIADPPYSYTGTFRFGWSLLYIGVLVVTAYGLGLPELPRTAGRALVTSIIAAASGAVVISVAPALHRRRAAAPVRGVRRRPILLVPWYLFCAGLGRRRPPDARPSATGCCSWAHRTRRPSCASTSRRAPERSAAIAGVVLPGRRRPARGQARGRRTARAPGARAQRHRGRARRRGRGATTRSSTRPPSCTPGACGCAATPSSTTSGSARSRSPISSGRRCCSTSARSTAPATAGVKRLLDIAIGLVGHGRLRAAASRSWSSATCSPTGARCCSARSVWARPARLPHPQVPHHGAPGQHGRRRPADASDDPRITPFGRLPAQDPPRRGAAGVERAAGDLVDRGPAPRAAPLRRRARREAALLRPAPPRAARAHRMGPGEVRLRGDEEDAREKLQYEFCYLRHQGLALDLRIIGRTIRSVIGGGGR